MKGKKFKKKIRRVQSRMKDKFGTDDVRYTWLLRLNDILHFDLGRAPTEDELFQGAVKMYKEQP